MKKEVKTFAGLKKGTRFVVVRNTNGHNYPLNKTLILDRDGQGGSMHNCAEGISGNNLSAGDILVIVYDLPEMTTQLECLQSQVKELEDTINLCRKYNISEYDENLVKAMRVFEFQGRKDYTKEELKEMVEIISGTCELVTDKYKYNLANFDDDKNGNY